MKLQTRKELMKGGEFRVMSLRIPESQALQVDLICRVDEVSQIDVVREAISEYVKDHLVDPLFQAKLRNRIARDNEILAQLTNGAKPTISETRKEGEMTRKELRAFNVKEARRLKDSGHSIENISAQIGMSQASVRLYLKETI